LIHLPQGCAFGPRCAYLKQECLREGPSYLIEVEPGHFSRCPFSGDIEFACQFENRVKRDVSSAGMGV
jgi:oligopeptide transport system ATP-binding protein